jgi:hypothetical protein
MAVLFEQASDIPLDYSRNMIDITFPYEPRAIGQVGNNHNDQETR